MRKTPELASCSCWLALTRLLSFLAVYPEGRGSSSLPLPSTVLSGKKQEKNMNDVIKGQEGLASGMTTVSGSF